MIVDPVNDRACLDAITQIVRDLVAHQDPELFALARKLGSLPAVVRWIQSLPQRDDTGDRSDGPHVAACRPPQRLRILAPDPNCVERTALYMVLAEFLNRTARRHFATIETPMGLHTLPVENGKPVILDPRVPRNCARAGLDRLTSTPLPTHLKGCASWVCAVAAEPAERLPGGDRRLCNARVALGQFAAGRGLSPGATEDVALALTLAAHEAPQWGPEGTRVVDCVAQAILDRPAARRNAVELKPGRYRLRPAVPKGLGAAMRALGIVGLNAGTAMARVKLAALGVSPAMLDVFESELNKDGLTLGPLAKPLPPPFSLAALQKDALLARHLEREGTA